MKEETLEEVAERLYPIEFVIDYDKNKEERDIWIKGAKYQLEKMDLEILNTLIKFSNDRTFLKENVARKWFNQFKKK